VNSVIGFFIFAISWTFSTPFSHLSLVNSPFFLSPWFSGRLSCCYCRTPPLPKLISFSFARFVICTSPLSVWSILLSRFTLLQRFVQRFALQPLLFWRRDVISPFSPTFKHSFPSIPNSSYCAGPPNELFSFPFSMPPYVPSRVCSPWDHLTDVDLFFEMALFVPSPGHRFYPCFLPIIRPTASKLPYSLFLVPPLISEVTLGQKLKYMADFVINGLFKYSPFIKCRQFIAGFTTFCKPYFFCFFDHGCASTPFTS